MKFFIFILVVLLVILIWVPQGLPYTVIMSDSGTPSALVDAPQTGFSINKNGAHTDPREQAAVYDIMKATGNGWATEIPDVCRGRWHGIECMPDKDDIFHVVSLSFGALSDDTAFPTCDQKHSFISPSITQLPHIRTLFFFRCFTYNPQPIPSFLGKLGPTLQTLVLRENGHVGPIPVELANLTRLRVLDLHKNKLNASIPVSLNRITGLRLLDLSCNRLTGPVPGLTYPVLNIFDLSQNLLRGSIPPSIGAFDSLIKMDLSRNRLSGPIPKSIGNLNNLMLMDLSYNHLSAPFPNTLGSLTSLQALILQGNPMGSMTILGSQLIGLKELKILVLSDMSLQGSIPEPLGFLTQIRVIHLDRNNLNGTIPTSFGQLKDLSELRLNDNQLTGQVPFRREMVWKMGRKLRLYNNSGLCYDPQNGLQGDGDLSLISGVSYCEPMKSTPTKTTTLHLSSVERHIGISVWRSGVPVHPAISQICLQLVLLHFFLYLLY